MRLINTRTLRIHDFVGMRVPPYAILSHTWGRGEVTFQDWNRPDGRHREALAGYPKIAATCARARERGLDFAWVDTCCIDKTSSAELSEVINSMFAWYRNAAECFGYLEDVEDPNVEAVVAEPSGVGMAGRVGFSDSRWFTRGWTLQELLAPHDMRFFTRDWVPIGRKLDMAEKLESITGIDNKVLEGNEPLGRVSIGRRMSWAANRRTSRPEDRAYSLLGIFGVNMPLIYGEGARMAFRRLQEQILARSDDHTIFAWRASATDEQDEAEQDGAATAPSTTNKHASGLLATGPYQFRNFLNRPGTNTGLAGSVASEGDPLDNIVRVWDDTAPQEPITLTNRGIRITGRVVDLAPGSRRHELLVLVLNCSPGWNPLLMTGIYIRRERGVQYSRLRPDELVEIEVGGDGSSGASPWLQTLTLYGLASAEDVRGHSYVRPWTSAAEIRLEMQQESHLNALGLGRLKDVEKEEEEEKKQEGGEESVVEMAPAPATMTEVGVVERYSNAFYMNEGCFNPRVLTGGGSPFGGYALQTILTGTSKGRYRLFRFDPTERDDLVIKNRSDFRAVLTFTSSGDPSHVLLVLLATNEVPLTGSSNERGDDSSPPRQGLWFNVVKSTRRDQWTKVGLAAGSDPTTALDPESLLLGAAPVDPSKPHHSVTVKVSGDLLVTVRVWTKATFIGLPMQHIEVIGPWPAEGAWLRRGLGLVGAVGVFAASPVLLYVMLSQ
ncbi:hypothetical protein RB601_006014 [Gaeumannomyces tritici]